MTLYDDLGVEKTADTPTIKRAYRNRAKQYHPDKPGGSAEAMAKLNRAVAILGDPIRRARYDATGDADHRPDDPLAAAREHIAQCLVNTIPNIPPEQVFQIDLVARMSDAFRGQIEDIRRKQADFRRLLHLWENTLKKFRHRNAKRADFIKGTIEQQIANAKRNVEEGDRQVKIREDAIDLLKDYEFQVDPASPIVRTTTLHRSFAQWNLT